MMDEWTLAARHSVHDFVAFCFIDADRNHLRQNRLHRELHAFLDAQRHALVELPRDHGKSVQICIRILWELGRNPNLRVKIICASDATAAERARFLRDAIARNPFVQLVFPQLRPGRPWTTTRFSLAGHAHAIGPNVTALGIGSVALGTRADLLVCDDVVDVTAIRSRPDRERVKTAFFDNLMNLLEPDGRFWGLFTPWHHEDLNAVLKRNPAFALFRREIGPNLEPVWPEKWPTEKLAQRRAEIGALAFARGYRLECVPEEATPIRAEWIRFWDCRLQIEDCRLPEQNAACGLSGNLQSAISNLQSPYELTILAVDPAVSAKETADRSALVTLSRTLDNQIHVREALARRVAAPELVQLLDDADRRWQPDVILFESNAAFAGLRDLLIRHARFGPKIKSVVQTKDKLSRIHAFSVPVENGTFRLQGAAGSGDPRRTMQGAAGSGDPRRASDDPRRAQGGVHPGQQELWDEMVTFPCGGHDDLVDAAAMGVAYLLERVEPRVW
jgi:phage terminase large subunit-like protein